MKPLDQVRIAVTRPAHQAAELAQPLEAAGAQVHLCPLIRMESALDSAQWEGVVAALPSFDWLVLTSVNGVEHLMRLLHERGAGSALLQHCRVACVGPATAAAAQRHGLTVAVTPPDFLGTALADAMSMSGPIGAQRILIARAAGGGAELPAQLRDRGGKVVDLELYRSVGNPEGAVRLRALISQDEVDVVTFTSGSAVTYFVEKVGNPANMAVAVIGPSTAQVAGRLGLRVDIEADPHTTAGMIQAIIDYHAARGGQSEV